VPLESKMKAAAQSSIDAGNIPNNAVISLWKHTKSFERHK
jgi:hypothetical protein